MYCTVAETDRLILRQMHVDDAHFMFHLNSDPEVIRYTGDPPFESIDEAKAFAEAYDPYSKDGFGRWMVHSKEHNELIGFCGLKMRDDGDVDLGYRLTRATWGRGYATESSRACIELARSFFHLPSLIAEARVENVGSLRVMKKLGFKFEKNDVDCGGETAIYRLVF